MNKVRSSIFAIAAGIAALACSPAWADLSIDVNGSQVAYQGDDTSTSCGGSQCGSYTGWGITEISVQGYSWDAPPVVFDGGTVNADFGTNASALTFQLNETNVPSAGNQSFGAEFTGVINGYLTVTRSFYIDPNDGTSTAGLTALASMTSTCVAGSCSNTCNGGTCGHNSAGNYIDFSFNTGSNKNGYSIIEVMTLTPTSGHTGSMSLDDQLQIPEPATLGLLGTGLVAFGAFRRRRKAAKKSA